MREKNIETNEKVLAMYKAVHELIMEGYDVANIKVSDITQRAGIGKGTAYEYFRSKEELLGKAIQYDFLIQYRMLEEKIQQENNMKSALEVLFQWLEKNDERKNILLQSFKLVGNSKIVCNETENNCVKKYMNLNVEIFYEILRIIVQLGRKEGIVSSECSDEHAQINILSVCMGYFVYTQFGEEKTLLRLQQTKDFLYKSVVNSLKNV